MSLEENEEHKLIKSREIPIFDYYSLLQVEWISYKVRELIYTRPEDKKKFNDISNMKRVKIESMMTKNCLPSIFNGDSVYLQKYFDKFFRSFGLPNFQVRDEYKKLIYNRYDALYWFSKRTEVKFKIEEEVEFGTITRYYEGICDIRDSNGTKYSIMCENVGRILTNGFLEQIK
jgi:hypothetical protein